MNILKFKDIVMTIDVLRDYGMIVDESTWDLTNTKAALIDALHITPEAFVDHFNDTFRNQYVYVVNWTHIIPVTYNPGNPFNDVVAMNYVYLSRHPEMCAGLFPFEAFEYDWYDMTETLKVIYDEQVKYKYINTFTPDDDITIDELRNFRRWLAQLLLADEPVIRDWPTEDMLRTMLTYYAQNMKDSTTVALTYFTPYMESSVLVAGAGGPINMTIVTRSAGCGCEGGVAATGGVSGTTGCDPLVTYRSAIYNYMVETFSNVNYWQQQVEICGEMKKYIDGIIKMNFPLCTKVVDPYQDCSCNSVDNDKDTRLRRMLEALSQALQYIIDGQVSGNRNFVTTALSNWATYLYENMYWL